MGCSILMASGCAHLLSPKTPESAPVTQESAPTPPTAQTAEQYFLVTEAQLERSRGNLDSAASLFEKALANDPDSVVLKRELVTLYMQMGKLALAEQKIRSLIACNPDDAETWFLWGRMFQEQKQEDKAIAAFTNAMNFNPDMIDVYYVLGDLYMEKGNKEEALNIYTKLAANHPESYVAHFYLGKLYAQQGSFERAEKELLQVTELAPDLVEPWFELAEVYRQTHRLSDMQKAYEAILQRSPDNVRALFGLGIVYAQSKNLGQTQRIFHELALKSLADINVIRTIVQDYVETERFSELLPAIDEMVSITPQSADLQYLTGITYEAVHRSADAITHYLLVGSDSRFYPSAIARIVFLYQQMKEPQKAVDVVQDAIEKSPDIAEFYLYLAVLKEDDGNLEQARDLLQHAISLDDQNDQFYFRLGVVLDKLEDKNGAIAAMKKAIEIDPENPNALNYLGYTYAEMGIELDEAESLIQKALQQKPDDGFIIDSLGWVYFKKGDFARALEYLGKAASMVSDDPTILEHAADAYLKTGQADKALELYRKALELAPKNAESLKQKIRGITEKNNAP
jgi:tetratricopeptide (TPR) repeat protein